MDLGLKTGVFKNLALGLNCTEEGEHINLNAVASCMQPNAPEIDLANLQEGVSTNGLVLFQELRESCCMQRYDVPPVHIYYWPIRYMLDLLSILYEPLL